MHFNIRVSKDKDDRPEFRYGGGIKHLVHLQTTYTDTEEKTLDCTDTSNAAFSQLWDETAFTIFFNGVPVLFHEDSFRRSRSSYGGNNFSFRNIIDYTFVFEDQRYAEQWVQELRAKYSRNIKDSFESNVVTRYERANRPPAPTVPVIKDAFWYQNCLLLAQIRFGKTSVICWRIAQLLPLIAQGKASIVLMEPKGVLTTELLHLAEVWGMRERVIIIDPLDTNISVNVFNKGDGSDHAINETIARVLRVLSTVTMTLTPFQTDALTYCLRAMFCIDQPGSMRLLTTILRRGIKDLPVKNLPYVVQEFFELDFKPGDGSAQQVIHG